MSDNLLICNASHECPVVECCHKVPHVSTFGDHCGPSMACYDSGLLSGCVPIKDGGYVTIKHKACWVCGGTGGHDEKIFHKVEEV